MFVARFLRCSLLAAGTLGSGTFWSTCSCSHIWFVSPAVAFITGCNYLWGPCYSPRSVQKHWAKLDSSLEKISKMNQCVNQLMKQLLIAMCFSWYLAEMGFLDCCPFVSWNLNSEPGFYVSLCFWKGFPKPLPKKRLHCRAQDVQAVFRSQLCNGLPGCLGLRAGTVHGLDCGSALQLPQECTAFGTGVCICSAAKDFSFHNIWSI